MVFEGQCGRLICCGGRYCAVLLVFLAQSSANTPVPVAAAGRGK